MILCKVVRYYFGDGVETSKEEKTKSLQKGYECGTG